LQVALSDLRSVLAGGGARQEARSFIHRSGEHYSLDVGPTGFIDAEAFEVECEAGRAADVAGDRERARAHLHAAEQLYVGDFLAEEHFMDWAETRRERLRDLYITSMQRLVCLYEAESRLDLVVTLTKRLLAVDPYLESYYRDLMCHQKRMGDLGGVVQTYLRCQQAMRDGFDTDVQPETRAVAEKLLGPPVDSILQRHAAARRRSLPRRVRGLPGRALSHAS
jgi:DNA-binding SARP family transcriptional activator